MMLNSPGAGDPETMLNRPNHAEKRHYPVGVPEGVWRALQHLPTGRI